VPRLILLLAIGLAGWIIYQRIKAMPPRNRKPAYIKLGLGILVVIVVIGVVTGRMHWLGAAITGLLVGASRLLPVLIRLFPVLQWFQQRSGMASPGSGNSEVETDILKMVLDHETGDLDGEVLDGEFSGRHLDDMDREELERLLAWCRGRDLDSSRLLESYLQRRFGDDWQGEHTPPGSTGGVLNETEALAILGLQPGASRDEIIEAHRKLMQKLHPDRGGNDYLASKLNQAKDFLLG
jgi:hypothetical protein